jgi:outer membrane beta-barrel protein
LRKHLAAALLAMAVGTPGWAGAQEQPDGLDLSDDTKEQHGKSKPKGDELDLTQENAASQSAPVAEEPVAEPASSESTEAKKEQGPAVERDVTQEDRVKSVQRKLYMKRSRFELAPAILINVNDAYYTKWGGSLRAAFYPADTLAISARFTLFDTVATDDVATAKRNLMSTIYYSVPYWTAMADVEWSPLYGKVAIFNSIIHLDGYLAAGAGVAFTQTAANSADPIRSGVKPAFDLGIGLRFVTKDWLAVNFGLINTSYVDTPIGTTKSALQNMMLIYLGVSIFFPFKSTFREAE